MGSSSSGIMKSILLCLFVVAFSVSASVLPLDQESEVVDSKDTLKDNKVWSCGNCDTDSDCDCGTCSRWGRCKPDIAAAQIEEYKKMLVSASGKREWSCGNCDTDSDCDCGTCNRWGRCKPDIAAAHIEEYKKMLLTASEKREWSCGNCETDSDCDCGTCNRWGRCKPSN